MSAIEALTESFSRLPGIGKKSAGRLVNYILKADAAWVKTFASQIAELQSKIHACSVCGAWTEEELCPVCADDSRDKTLICVVEQPQDVATIESTKEYKGLFHVLGGVIAPLEGVGVNQLRIAQLSKRANDGIVKEVIIATNPTVEGDTTALYIQKVLQENKNLTITRLASGIPVGGDLEYADRLTLARSFRGRTRL